MLTPSRVLYTRISQASLLLPIFVGFTYYSRLTLSFRILLYYLVLCIGFEILGTLLSGPPFNNNMPGLHLFVPVQFIAYSMIFLLHAPKGSRTRIFIGVNIGVGMALVILNAFVFGSLKKMPDVSRAYCAVFVMLYALHYYYTLFRLESTQWGWEHPMFWLSTGALIYFGILMFYFMFNRYLLLSHKKVETYSLIVTQGLNIITHCLYARAFWCFRKKVTL